MQLTTVLLVYAYASVLAISAALKLYDARTWARWVAAEFGTTRFNEWIVRYVPAAEYLLAGILILIRDQVIALLIVISVTLLGTTAMVWFGVRGAPCACFGRFSHSWWLKSINPAVAIVGACLWSVGWEIRDGISPPWEYQALWLAALIFGIFTFVTRKSDSNAYSQASAVVVPRLLGRARDRSPVLFEETARESKAVALLFVSEYCKHCSAAKSYMATLCETREGSLKVVIMHEESSTSLQPSMAEESGFSEAFGWRESFGSIMLEGYPSFIMVDADTGKPITPLMSGIDRLRIAVAMVANQIYEESTA